MSAIQKRPHLKHVTDTKKKATPTSRQEELLSAIQKRPHLKHVTTQNPSTKHIPSAMEEAFLNNPKFVSILKQRREEPEEEVEGVDSSEWNGGVKRKSRKLKRKLRKPKRKSRKPKRKSHNSTRKLRK